MVTPEDINACCRERPSSPTRMTATTLSSLWRIREQRDQIIAQITGPDGPTTERAAPAGPRRRRANWSLAACRLLWAMPTPRGCR
jgi:hypothetical protein